ALPRVEVRRDDEVGEDEDECLCRQVAPVVAVAIKTTRDGVVTRAEGPVEGSRFGDALAARRPPVRLAMRVVEIAGEAACCVRARPDQVERGEDGARLVETPERRGGDAHRRTPVAEDDD